MNEQQLQQILTIQQAIAAAATAAVINSLLNPQQAAQGLAGANGLAGAEPQAAELQQGDSRQQSPAASSVSSPANPGQQSIDGNRIQELLLQLQQQAAASGAAGAPTAGLGAAGAALNLNLSNLSSNNQTTSSGSGGGAGHSPALHHHHQQQHRSPGNQRLSLAQQQQQQQFAPTSQAALGNKQQSNQLIPSNKKLKRHHQAPQPSIGRALEATSKPQPLHPAAGQPPAGQPKSQLAIPNYSSSRSNSNNSNTTNSSSSSASFLTNNVGLPRKLVRGQDVWLGRGAEQTRQILKCMWCGQSFRTLAEMTQHMKITQHYTNIISQEQITSWKQPDGSESGPMKGAKQHADGDDKLPVKSAAALAKQGATNADHALANRYNVDNQQHSPASTRSNLSSASSPKPPSSQQQQDNGEAKSESAAASLKNDDDDEADEADVDEDAEFREEELLSKLNNEPASGDEDVDETREEDDELKRESDEAERKLDDEASEPDEQLAAASKHQEGRRETNGLIEDKEKKSTSCEQADHESANELDAGPNNEDEAEHDRDPEGANQGDTDGDGHGQEADETVKSKGKKPSGNSKSSDINKKANSATTTGSSASAAAAAKKLRSRLREQQQVPPTSQAPTTGTHGPAKQANNGAGQQAPAGDAADDSDDPLSALETMVEKSFDPRLRPGVANGGILQRLGIDEEVCPPWQHINYANWYAAAAYGHPMAAALLAAGINLQNGIKLSKNVNTTNRNKTASDDD